jgi:tetratricopeptide (TPR) repeat protein
MNPAEDAFAPLVGVPSWLVERGVGSYITLQFGQPLLDIAEPRMLGIRIAGAPRQAMQRRAYVRGQWHLWIYDCCWSLSLHGIELAHDQSDVFTVDRALGVLNGQALSHVRIEPDDATTTFAFDLGCVLTTTPARLDVDESEPDEQWLLFQPSHEVLTVRRDGTYQTCLENASPDDAPWVPLLASASVLTERDSTAGLARIAQRLPDRHVNDAGEAAYWLDEALRLGIWQKSQGDISAARATYQWVIGSRQADRAPDAAVQLGVLESQQDRPEAARAAYQLAIASGHPDYAAQGLFNLANLEDNQGQVEAARAAYRQAIQSGHDDVAAKAADNLGLLEKEQGQFAAARAAFQQAISLSHDDASPKAAVVLGTLEEQQGRLAAARAAYRLAIESGHTTFAPSAAYCLGRLEADQGHAEAARTEYRRAIASGHSKWAPQAAVDLNFLEWKQGQTDSARAAFQQALASDNADAVAAAHASLAQLNGPIS